MFRVGIGYDSHRFQRGRPLVLGGVNVHHHSGLQGHSDGDVLVHAIIDALLGAAGMADIGTHFPDSDPQYRGASSVGLLRYVVNLITAEGWTVINVDATVLTEEPRLRPYIPEMVRQLEQAGLQRVNIKAKTNEGMGFVGRGEGMVAIAVCLLSRS